MTTDELLDFQAPHVAASLAVEGAHVLAHAAITWLDIHADGSETRRTGHVWEAAPALTGAGRAYWVLPEIAVEGEPTAVLVVRAGRRHRCGRPTTHPRDKDRTTWNRRGGRFIDKGEFYRETDPRSRVAHVESGATAQRGWSLPGLLPTNTIETDQYENWLRAVEAAADRAAADRAAAGR